MSQEIESAVRRVLMSGFEDEVRNMFSVLLRNETDGDPDALCKFRTGLLRAVEVVLKAYSEVDRCFPRPSTEHNKENKNEHVQG